MCALNTISNLAIFNNNSQWIKALISTPGRRVSDTVGLADCFLTSGVLQVCGKQTTRAMY